MNKTGINSFLIDNLWIYHLILAILLVLIIYFFILIKKTRERKAFLSKLSNEQGPLAPRNLLPTLINSIPDLIYIKDVNGKFIVANKKIAEIMGAESYENLIGSTDFDFYPNKMAQKFRLDELEIMNSGKAMIDIIEKGMKPDGDEIWLNTTKIPIKNSAGKVVGIAGIGKDITEAIEANDLLEKQKTSLEEANTRLKASQEEILQQQEKLKIKTEEISQERSRLLTLINSIPDRIYIKDRESRFVLGNETVARIMGASPEELIGKTDFDFYSKDLAEIYFNDEQDQMKKDIKIINKEERGIDEYGKEVIVSTTKIPFKNTEGEVIGVVGIGRDITFQKNAAEELMKKGEVLSELNAQLEERQEEITQQAEELKVQAENIAIERNQLLTLINSMPDRIYIKDRESRFIQGNIHVAKIMGASGPEELVGKTDMDFYPEELGKAYFDDEQECMQKGEPIINKEEKGINESGNEIFVSTTKIPFRNKKGEVIGIVGIGRDITTQKNVETELKMQSDSLKELNVLLEERQEEIQQQAEELKAQTESLENANKELEKLSAVASKTGNVIVIMDAEGNFEWVNSGFVERYGMDLEVFIQERGRNLRENSSNDEILNIFEEIKKDKKPRVYNAKTTHRDKKTSWSQTTISPILDENGEIINLIAIDTDISQLKEAEIKIEAQRDELKKLNATKDKFFSIIAHDLKNPFHSIMGFSDLLNRSFDSLENERKKEFIQLINNSSTSAYALLENLLNWARTQTNKIKFEPSELNVRGIINEIFAMMGVNAQNKKIEFVAPEGEEEIKAYADYNMVNTIIRNLVNNALKFTDENGKISIRTEIKNKRQFISVVDTGIGMTEEVSSKLFKLDDFQTRQGTEGETGTGLGLIVCREFVLLHGGDFDISSEPGKGSTFTFSLPMDASTIPKEKSENS